MSSQLTLGTSGGLCFIRYYADRLPVTHPKLDLYKGSNTGSVAFWDLQPLHRMLTMLSGRDKSKCKMPCACVLAFCEFKLYDSMCCRGL